MKDWGKLSSDFLAPLSKITNPEHTSQFKLVKSPDSNKFIDILIGKIIPVTINDTLYTFRDAVKKFELEKELVKTATYKKYNVDLAKLPDKKLMFEFGQEVYFEEKALG